ncbi:MAG: hypothetical protein K8R74_06650 [Bacteroidales bacterium]|nr:hypothetical protein [Bacteroidales bacterium]
MKAFLHSLIAGLIFLWFPLFGQESKKPFPKDSLKHEVTISINWSDPNIDYIDKSLGYGFAYHHAFMMRHRVNLILGVEFNRLNRFIETLYYGAYTKTVNETYVLTCLSFPLGIRINFGRKTKFFFEPGIFIDLTTYSDPKLNNSVGLYVGAGLRIPVSKYEFLIKNEFKAGFNSMSSQWDIYTVYYRFSIGLKI